MSSIYLSQAAMDMLAAAQRVIDEHISSCDRCGTNQPCYDRIEAEQVFAHYGKLPRRTPGLTTQRAEQHTAFKWLAG